MTDQTTTTVGSEAPNVPLIIHGQYIKDLSFEIPNAPAIFQEIKIPPEVIVHVDIDTQVVHTKTFEVMLSFHVRSTSQNKIAFILELTYAAIVSINVPQEHVQPLIMIEVPRLLFPFARSIIADTSRDSGFPPLVVAPVDFVALYRQRLEDIQYV